MSPDDIFAAQFWPWPDPAIKRDAQGRVLFVNAAFLALYGGQVQNWRGSAVGGWPAPQAIGSAPYRFETRIPAGDGSEQVYDWMEQTLTDGTAFALARNVTVFVQMPDPDPATQADTQNLQVQSAPEIQSAVQQAPAFDTQTAQVYTEPAAPEYAEAPAFHAPAFQVPDIQAPAAEAPTFQAPAQHIPNEPAVMQAPQTQPAESLAIQDIEIPDIDIPSDTNYALTDTTAPAQLEAYTPPPAAVQAPEAEREYERRALPIEDDSAVLGTNWRDAVIAKAIGASAPQPESHSEPETNMAPESQAPSAGGAQIRILLAEDNAINALLTRTLLEAEGHSVDTVEDGVLAVEAMKTASYDLIFMDMRMPNMDGLEATRKIRSLSNVGRSLPIIALTANAFDDDRNACFDSGMNDFMTKPVSAEELSEKVRDWTSADAKARLIQAA